MGSIVVRNLDDDLKARLRIQAARHGRSMEAEAREILRKGIDHGDREPAKEQTVGEVIDELFGPEHGFDLEPYLPKREMGREPPTFD